MRRIIRSSPKTAPSICMVSRCAWTFYNFRLRLALEVARVAAVRVVAAGISVQPYVDRIEAEGLDFAEIRGRMHGTNPFHIALFTFDLYRLYRRTLPKIVHHFTIKPVIFGTIAARVAGVPKIVNTISGLGQAFDSPRSLSGIYAKLLYRLSLRFSDHVFFQNKDDQALFVGRGFIDAAKTSIVPGSGVDVQRFTPSKAAPEARDPVVLMVARLLKTKGVYEFVEAAQIVKRDNPAAKFVLLGGLDFKNPAAIEEAHLQKWQRQGLIDWINHQDDIRPYLEAAEVVVLPSYYREGVPRVLLEAAAMAKAIVTTDNTGCREVVKAGINGLIVPPRDADALAGAIRSILKDPILRKRMGNAGRKIMVERFDERFIVERTIEAYGLCRT
jgi:glycosyltransferase involved in cell wall biosynthesis